VARLRDRGAPVRRGGGRLTAASETGPSPAGERVKAGAGITGAFTTSARSDGKMQVACNDVQLYYYATDTKAGNVNGRASTTSGSWPRPDPATGIATAAGGHAFMAGLLGRPWRPGRLILAASARSYATCRAGGDFPERSRLLARGQILTEESVQACLAANSAGGPVTQSPDEWMATPRRAVQVRR
jgi:hypothetical protein